MRASRSARDAEAAVLLGPSIRLGPLVLVVGDGLEPRRPVAVARALEEGVVAHHVGRAIGSSSMGGSSGMVNSSGRVHVAGSSASASTVFSRPSAVTALGQPA
jgi:hypothetical protein